MNNAIEDSFCRRIVSVTISPSSSTPEAVYLDGNVISPESEGEKLKRKKGRRKSGSKKHRAGKNQKRKYKPFHKMTDEERKKHDEWIRKRSILKRAYLRSCGVPLAPQNTTQYLVNDNIQANSLSRKFEDGNVDDFQEIWSHRFEHLSKSDLVEWYMSLEEEIELFQSRLEAKKTRAKAVLEMEVPRKECEIEALMKVNEQLKKMVKDLPCKDEKVIEEKDQHLEWESPYPLQYSLRPDSQRMSEKYPNSANPECPDESENERT